MNSVIYFYSSHDDYGEFSNFALYPIKLKKKIWPTSEHYFQAMKFKDKVRQEQIRKANTPNLAAQMGRDRRYKLRPDWESCKETIMQEVLLAKFQQYAELKELLLSTGHAKIVEHTENDAYWGDGGDGSGRNRLGILLMAVRQQLQSS
jgi:hypothetical protein